MKLDFSKVLYGYVIMALYLMVGVFCLVKYWMMQDKPNSSMVLFGVLVILYGAYRGYRSYIASQTPKDETDEV
jgi:hypothetical protein